MAINVFGTLRQLASCLPGFVPRKSSAAALFHQLQLAECDRNSFVRLPTTEGQKRLRRVAKLCETHGQRVQRSVFECVLDSAQWATVRARLASEIGESEDSLRFYFLRSNLTRRVEHPGTRPSYNPEGLLII